MMTDEELYDVSPVMAWCDTCNREVETVEENDGAGDFNWGGIPFFDYRPILICAVCDSVVQASAVTNES